MTLDQAMKQVDHTLASLFYDRMKNLKAESENAHVVYKATATEMSQLLLHMRERIEVLFGQDTEKLTQFLSEAGVVPQQQQ